MVTDPPYCIELDSEWRDRAGLNGHGPAEPSYVKKRIAGHTEGLAPVSLENGSLGRTSAAASRKQGPISLHLLPDSCHKSVRSSRKIVLVLFFMRLWL